MPSPFLVQPVLLQPARLHAERPPAHRQGVSDPAALKTAYEFIGEGGPCSELLSFQVRTKKCSHLGNRFLGHRGLMSTLTALQQHHLHRRTLSLRVHPGHYFRVEPVTRAQSPGVSATPVRL